MEISGVVRVVKGTNLPKTDRLSKIDAYVVIKQNSTIVGKTRVVDDNENPTWDEPFPVVLSKDKEGKIHGYLEMLLYDENTFKDKHVGTIKIDISTLTPQQLQYMEVPLDLTEEKFKKQGLDSRVGISIQPGPLTYQALKSMWAATPGLITVDAKRQLYMPFADPAAGPLYLGVEYEGPNIDVKVFVTVPGFNLHTDMFLAYRKKTKIRRNQYPQGQQIAPGLVAYQEIKMDDVPPSTDFNLLSVMVHDAQYISGTNAADIVKAHGWKGALNFRSACQVLRNIDVDHPEEEIYMGVDPGETCLIVDWDDSDVDIKLAIMATPATMDKAYDLTITGQTVKKTSEIYQPPKQVLSGKFALARLYQLDDLKYGSSLKTIEIHRLQLSNMRQYTIQGLCRIMG